VYWILTSQMHASFYFKFTSLRKVYSFNFSVWNIVGQIFLKEISNIKKPWFEQGYNMHQLSSSC
jgi:hypothetical protein